MKQKATNKQTKTHRHRQDKGKGRGREVVTGKGGQICGDRRRFDFGSWAQNVVYK